MRAILFLIVLSIVIPTGVLAHKGATGIVMQRMLLMKSLADNMKAVSSMLRGKAPFDRKAIDRAAVQMKGHGEKILTLFPKGSTQHPSEAKATIWSAPEGFKKSSEELVRFSEGLRVAAGDRSKALKAFALLAGTCKGCHQDYREKK